MSILLEKQPDERTGMGQEADNRATKRTASPAEPAESASVIEPKSSYPVDPDRLLVARGARTRAEVVTSVAGVSSEKYRKIEAGKTRTVVGSELLDLARSLGVPATALLAEDHPSRTGLQGRGEVPRILPKPTSNQKGHIERALERLRAGVRLQSLIGPRGVGKTTLANQLREQLQRQLGPGARLVSLLDQCQPWEL